MSKDQEIEGLGPILKESAVMNDAANRPLKNREKPALSDAEQQRRERAAAKLRENLARRKQQSRARRAGEAEDGNGLPAAHADIADQTLRSETDAD